jgi:putative ABC transport system substrate-binding protein
MIGRRGAIGLLGGAVAWPLAARAQRERMRRIGVLMTTAVDDPEGQARHTAFAQGLQQWGWLVGRNVQIDIRWGATTRDSARRYATELAALAPDVIFATGSVTVGPLLEVTHSIPIVFVLVPDPASSTVWHSPAAMPPASSISNMGSARNGWSCSRRCRPA